MEIAAVEKSMEIAAVEKSMEIAAVENSMEITAIENSKSSTLSSSDIDPHLEKTTLHISNHEEMEPKYDIRAEEVRSVMEVIASTGKFWHDWEILKSMLSFRLKQVLEEYPESQMVSGDVSRQSSLSGETYPELVKRLDEALLGFIEGPPFTLQRICEILLTPKNTYRNISKLALALEKNLLVTSTLTICTDPYPAALIQKQEEPAKLGEELQDPSAPVPNGAEPKAGDADEEMANAEAIEDVMNTDTEMQEEKASTASESIPNPSPDCELSKEP